MIDWMNRTIENLQKEITEEHNREYGYLKDLDKCSYYDLVDRGIDPDVQMPSLYR